MAMGYKIRGRWLYWGYPITRYHLLLARGRRYFNRIRDISAILLGVNFLFWFGWLVYRNDYVGIITSSPRSFITFFSSIFNHNTGLLFFLTAVCFLYLWYRLIIEGVEKKTVERFDYINEYVPVVEEGMMPDWTAAQKISRRHRLDISKTFTEEALLGLNEAYRLADKMNHAQVTVWHLFYVSLNFNRISNVFIRLGISVSSLQTRILPILEKGQVISKSSDRNIMPLPSSDFSQCLFAAYDSAYQAHQDYVSIIEILVASVQLSQEIQEILFDFNIQKQKLNNAVEWGRIRERLYRQYKKFKGKAARRSKKGMDRAMTAVQTPYLNHFSEDVTLLAQFGHLDMCVARERETEEMFRVVAGGQQSIILVGDNGVGKRSIVEGVAQKMVMDDVPKRMRDKRMVRLSISSLLAGTTPAGAVERLQRIMREIARAGNIILFIHNIHELIGVSAGDGEGPSLDVAGTLAEYLAHGRFLTLATTTNDDYARYFAGSSLSSLMSKVEIREMDENQTIQVLESKVGYAEYKQKVFFSYNAIEKSAQLARKFIHEAYLPGSALEIMTEAAVHTFAKKGANALVTAEEVAQVVAQKTKIPVTTVTADESEKLMRLEEQMHKRVIGQDEAVNLVANSLRRARAEIRSTNRPISSFLFLGPTGVGKTELAKTIAAVYFGGEDKIIRLDMSEYQERGSIDRLIGLAGQKGTGILTEAVRRNPFALILLDEIEKADKDILNLFLQVLDDGRLTDSTGHVYDFTNVIIIATSNASATYVQEQLHRGLSTDAIKEHLLHGELGSSFKPEFLNRFDGIVLFKPLTRADIKTVAGLMLKRLSLDLESKGVLMEITNGVLEFLADVGFDPDFGARPMRRAIQERIENKLAEMLLSGQIKHGMTVVLGERGVITTKS